MNFKKSLLSCVILSGSYLSTGQTQTLQEAVQLTLNENPEIQEARSVRMAYEQEIDQAASTYLPTIDVSAGYGLEQANTNATRGRAFNGPSGTGVGTQQLGRTDSNVKFNQMIFDGFKTPHEVARFTSKTDAQAYTVFGQSEIIGLQATQAYINVLLRQALFDLAASNLSLHKGFYDQIKMRTERGIGRVSDLDQATGRLARAESNLQAEQGNLKDAQTSYLRVIGVLPNQLSEIQRPTQALPASLEEATDLALANHPTLKAANADITESLAQHNTASAPFYPKLNFEVNYDNNDDVGGFRGRYEDLTAMVKVNYNLFNGGKDKARRNQTAYEMYQSKNIRDNTYRQVVETLRLSWVAYKTVGSQLEFFKAHRDSSTKALNAYKQQFNIGQRTLLDLLDSTNEMYLANINYTEAKYKELGARYRILASMGRLNKYLGTTLPDEAKPITPDKKQPEMLYTAATETKTTEEPNNDTYKDMQLAETNPVGTEPKLDSPVTKPLESKPSYAPVNAPAAFSNGGADENNTSNDPESTLKQRLNDWAAAWSKGNIKAYLSYYESNYTPDATAVNHAAWKRTRVSRISPTKQIQVLLSDINIKKSGAGDTATTSFRQVYNSKNYHDESKKIMVWKNVNGAWLIHEERSVE
ncbi:MAG: TolC family outer membrane protein [Methylococcaceae bacterium]|nr:TolC family outer membrane protein [Methylococcaceae bacterium]